MVISNRISLKDTSLELISKSVKYFTTLIYLFIYFLFFREGGGGGEGKLGRITLGTHKRHRIQFKHAGVSNLEESSCSWSFETRIYIFYEQREREEKSICDSIT